MTAAQHRSDDGYLSAKSVRERYDDVSDMTLHRWQHDSDLGFPKPVYINGRRYWKERKLIVFERRQTRASKKRVAR